MKHNMFSVAVIAFAATTTSVVTVAASLLPTLTQTAVYVRRIEANAPTTAKPNVSVGTWDLAITTTGPVVSVLVDDTTTPQGVDTRAGRFSNDALIKTATQQTLAASGPPVLP